jgi:hypothetical protein
MTLTNFANMADDRQLVSETPSFGDFAARRGIPTGALGKHSQSVSVGTENMDETIKAHVDQVLDDTAHGGIHKNASPAGWLFHPPI